MRIGLSYDLKQAVAVEHTAPDDALEEYDSSETVELIAAALETTGHSVVMLGGGKEFLANILGHNVDVVFNIAEGRGRHRSREAQVPAILEMLGIPYSGSDPQCLTICLDKPLAKKLAVLAGVSTPEWQAVADRDELRLTPWSGFGFPAIVKPAYEGSSKGIRSSSVVNTPEQATEAMETLLRQYGQPVMVEEFIAGDEVTVGMVGNSPPKVLGMMRILPKTNQDYFIYSVEVKRDYQRLVDYECPARFSDQVLERLRTSSLRAFQALGCRDFARLDFRVSPEGVPYFLEVNPLPGLGRHSDLVIMAQKMGWSHQELIAAVLDAARRRYPQCVGV
ncbi:MAG: ATP-grasp domain-containing protein [Chloroflexi bacterium]|nr:ATP-grasp domain-containing protein [Chloroflexota bacterium]